MSMVYVESWNHTLWGCCVCVCAQGQAGQMRRRHRQGQELGLTRGLGSPLRQVWKPVVVDESRGGDGEQRGDLGYISNQAYLLSFFD